jgi:glyoxylase-like metal-dependent hydrolase (beta-lactamase superfamily II)
VLAAAGYADDRGANAVVIFDGQLLLPYANEVAPYVQTLGKPIDRTILSHAHTDHWGGLQVLTERFPDARVFALDGIADQVRARGPVRLDGLRSTYGDRATTKVTVPTETITEGPQRIDGAPAARHTDPALVQGLGDLP